MASPKIFIRDHQSGFTLIELLVSMSIFLILAGSMAFVSMRSFFSSSEEDEEMIVVALLQKARSEAMNNVCEGNCTGGEMHGVHFDSDSITLFQGTMFDVHNENNIHFDHISNTGFTDAIDITFAAGSGNATFFPASATSVSISMENIHATVGVSPHGMIDWSL